MCFQSLSKEVVTYSVVFCLPYTCDTYYVCIPVDFVSITQLHAISLNNQHSLICFLVWSTRLLVKFKPEWNYESSWFQEIFHRVYVQNCFSQFCSVVKCNNRNDFYVSFKNTTNRLGNDSLDKFSARVFVKLSFAVYFFTELKTLTISRIFIN